jgi:hypothetical protein
MTQTKRRIYRSPSEKQELADEARARRFRGEQWVQITEALGVCAHSLRLWMRQTPQAGFRPVEIVGDTRVDATNGLKLTTPEGIVIEGLSVEAAIQLCGALR